MLAEVLMVHCRDDLVGDDGCVDPRKLDAVGRLGGDWYVSTAPGLFEIARPPKPS